MLASLTGTAAAEMVPEDPYKDVEPTKVELLKVEVDATSGVGPVIKSDAAAAGSASPIASPPTFASTTEVSEQVGEEWWEQQEVQVGGGVGFGLLFLGLVIRGRRNAHRRRQLLADRRTQFGMSAVDPKLAKLNVAAWERGPAIMPTAIEPEMVRPSRPGSAPFVVEAAQFVASNPQPFVAPSSQPYAAAPGSQPFVSPSSPYAPAPQLQPTMIVAQPLPSLASAQSVRPATPAYRHYSEADLAAYGMRPSQPDVAPVATIAQSSSAPAARQGSQPALVIPPHAAVQAAQVQQQLAHRAVHVAPSSPAPMHAQAYQVESMSPQPIPSLPQPNQAPRGSWHPTVLPWDQAAQAPSHHAPFVGQQAPHHAPALAPFVGQQAPHHAPALQAFVAPAPTVGDAPAAQALVTPAPNARRARLAEGTPQPPIANPQPFVALPPQALPKPPIAQSQRFAPHAMPARAPQAQPFAPHAMAPVAPRSFAPHAMSSVVPHSFAPHAMSAATPHAQSFAPPHAQPFVAPHSQPFVAPSSQPVAPHRTSAAAPQSFAPHAMSGVAPHAQAFAPPNSQSAAPHAMPTVAPHSHPVAPHSQPAPHAMSTVAPHLAQTCFAQDADATRQFTPAPAMPPSHVASAPVHPYAAMQAPLPPMPFPPVGTPVAVPLQPELARVGGPQSFVLESSSARLPQMPATYPLTFPAFPEAAGAVTLAPIEPSGLNYWGPPTTEVDGESILFSQLADEPQLARGSQPDEHLEPVRVALPQAAMPDAETRITPAPLDKRTFDMQRRR